MLEILLAVAAIVAVSLLYGLAIWRASGFRRTLGAAPAVGFGALLVLAWLAVRLTGSPGASGAILAVLALACAISLRGERGRGAGRDLGPWALVALAALALTSLPLLVSGRVGILAVGLNNDTNVHLLGAWWLQVHPAVDPSALIATGYPMGPHAVAAAVSSTTGMGLEPAFTGLMMAILVLSALTALGGLREGRVAARGALAVLVGVCYLTASYHAQASFKETIEALLLVGFAVALGDAAGSGAGARRALPLGALAAGSVYSYSYLGPLWLATGLAVWLTVEVLRSPRTAARRARGLVAPAAVGGGAFLLLSAPQVNRVIAFVGSRFNHEPLEGLGNLSGPLSPLEVLGVWLTPDFRVNPPAVSLAGALLVLAAIAAAVSLVWSLRRRQLVVPAMLVGALAIYALAAATRSPYQDAKALAVAAPLVALLMARAALAAPRMSVGGHGRRRVPGWAPGALVVVVSAAAGASSFLALRDAAVGPTTRARELAALRPLLHGRPTLYLGDDSYAGWELRGVPIWRQPAYPYPVHILSFRPSKRWRRGRPVDFDTPVPGELDRFPYAIVPRAPFASRPPANWRPLVRTRSYVLYRREGPTLARSVLPRERGRPGAILNCAEPGDRALSRRAGVAGVLPAPVLVPRSAWHGPLGRAGRAATLFVRLPRGRWDLSLEYVSRQPMTVRAPGLRARLPASLERLSTYWAAGTMRVARAGRVRVTVTPDRLWWPGRLLGAPGATFTAAAPLSRPLGGLALTRHGVPERLVPLARACGRYVDWYRLGSPARDPQAVTRRAASTSSEASRAWRMQSSMSM